MSTRMPLYRDLAKFVFALLSLPLSNAEVERIFSMLAIVKSKLRNRMLIDTVDGIISVRYGLLYEKQTCYDYAKKLPNTVLADISSSRKYESDTDMNYEEIYEIFFNTEWIFRCEIVSGSKAEY